MKTATEIESICNKFNLAIDACRHDLKTLKYDEMYLSVAHKVEIVKNIMASLTHVLEYLIILKVMEDMTNAK